MNVEDKQEAGFTHALLRLVMYRCNWSRVFRDYYSLNLKEQKQMCFGDHSCSHLTLLDS